MRERHKSQHEVCDATNKSRDTSVGPKLTAAEVAEGEKKKKKSDQLEVCRRTFNAWDLRRNGGECDGGKGSANLTDSSELSDQLSSGPKSTGPVEEGGDLGGGSTVSSREALRERTKEARRKGETKGTN